MRKIPSIFQRNYETDRLIRDEVVPWVEWVLRGEGVATRKYDGTCCMIHGGNLFKRYEAKKPPPPDFIPAQDRDDVTGHWVGWRPCLRSEPGDKYYWEAFDSAAAWADGTYELIGPKAHGNNEHVDRHMLVRHADAEAYPDCPRTFDGIREWLRHKDIEGIVFHHPDGRMAKVKKKDYGMKRVEAP